MTDLKIRRTTGLPLDLDERKQTIVQIDQKQSDRCFAFVDQDEKSVDAQACESDDDERRILPLESSGLLWTLLGVGLLVPGDRRIVLCHPR